MLEPSFWSHSSKFKGDIQVQGACRSIQVCKSWERQWVSLWITRFLIISSSGPKDVCGIHRGAWGCGRDLQTVRGHLEYSASQVHLQHSCQPRFSQFHNWACDIKGVCVCECVHLGRNSSRRRALTLERKCTSRTSTVWAPYVSCTSGSCPILCSHMSSTANSPWVPLRLYWPDCHSTFFHKKIWPSSYCVRDSYFIISYFVYEFLSTGILKHFLI